MELNYKKILLQKLLQNFDIPEYKKKLNKNNLQWLAKNLNKRNKNNQYFDQANELIHFCLDQKLYTN